MGQYLGIGICVLVGGVCFIFAVKKVIETMIFLRNAQKTMATVVSYDSSHSSGSGATYMPILEFKTTGDKKVQFTSTVATNPPAYKLGEQVEIRFLPKNPQAAKINSFYDLWLLTTILAFVALVCFITAISMYSAQ